MFALRFGKIMIKFIQNDHSDEADKTGLRWLVRPGSVKWHRAITEWTGGGRGRMKRAAVIMMAVVLLFQIYQTDKGMLVVAEASDNPVNLNVAVTVDYRYKGRSPEELPFIDELEKEANVSVSWQVYDESTWQEQLQMVMESDRQPDIYINCISEENFAQYRDQFMELDPLIDENAPNIRAAYEEDPILREYSTQADGHIYGLASRRPYRPKIWKKWIINEEWLKRVGMEQPKTWAELKEVLRAFRDQDANGNGDPDDEIPMAIDSVRIFSYIIMGGMGRYADTQGLSCCRGSFVYLPTTQDWRETMEFLHDLYEEGLLYRESTSISGPMLRELGRDPEAARIGVTLGWSANEIFGPQWESQYAVMDQPAAQEGIDPVYTYQIYDSKTYAKHCAQISSKCKNPEAAIRFLDLFYMEKYSVQAYYGSMGVGIGENGDGTYRVLVPDGYGDEDWQRMNSMVDNGIYYFSDSLESRITPPASIIKLIQDEEGKNTVLPSDGEAVGNVHLTDSEILEAGRIQQSLENLSEKAMAEFLYQGVSEEAWEKFQDNLLEAGVDRLLEIYENARARET